jgi:hypothetical protein
VKETLLEYKLEVPHALLDHPHYSLAKFSVEFVRNKKQILSRAPTEADPSHVHVIGDKPKSFCKRLSKECLWEIRPSREALIIARIINA